MSTPDPAHLNARAYDRIADQWAEARAREGISPLIDEFAALLKPGAEVLDVGCGTGYPIAHHLAHQGYWITGIDLSERMVRKARALELPQAVFHVADMRSYTPDRTFGGIMAFDSLFHLPKEAQPGIYAQLAAWMDPGAPLLFTHGKRESEITGEMFGEVFHYSCLDTGTVHALLAAAGLEVLRSTEGYTEPTMDRDLVILARKR